MRLTELEPRFVAAIGRHGQMLAFRCPLHPDDEKDQLAVPFANPIDGGAPRPGFGWQRIGEAFDSLTLTPSIHVTGRCKHGAAWHGFITNGEVTNA